MPLKVVRRAVDGYRVDLGEAAIAEPDLARSCVEVDFLSPGEGRRRGLLLACWDTMFEDPLRLAPGDVVNSGPRKSGVAAACGRF